MKVKVKATGEIIEVMPSYVNDEVVCYKHEQESGGWRIYRPEEVDDEPHIREMEQMMQETKERHLESLLNPNNRYNYTVTPRHDWAAIRISAAQSALQACIIVGKPNPVQSAMRYSKELVDALRAEFE